MDDRSWAVEFDRQVMKETEVVDQISFLHHRAIFPSFFLPHGSGTSTSAVMNEVSRARQWAV